MTTVKLNIVATLDGKHYVIDHSGARRRVAIVANSEGQPTAVGMRKSGKAERKADKRAKQRARRTQA